MKSLHVGREVVAKRRPQRGHAREETMSWEAMCKEAACRVAQHHREGGRQIASEEKWPMERESLVMVGHQRWQWQ